MKRVILLSITLLLFVSGAMAQEQTSSNTFFKDMSTRDYNRIHLGFNPMNIRWQDNLDANFKLCPLSMSVSVGYLHGSNLVESIPLYIEYGASFQYSFGKSNDEKKYGSGTNYDVNTVKMYSFNVPVNISLRLGFKNNKIGILPYAGLNMRYNVAGNIEKFKGAIVGNGFGAMGGSHTTTYKLFDSSDDKYAMGEKALNRFQLGINAGVGFTFGKFYVGAGYTADVTKIANNAGREYVGSLGVVNISVGLSF